MASAAEIEDFADSLLGSGESSNGNTRHRKASRHDRPVVIDTQDAPHGAFPTVHTPPRKAKREGNNEERRRQRRDRPHKKQRVEAEDDIFRDVLSFVEDPLLRSALPI